VYDLKGDRRVVSFTNAKLHQGMPWMLSDVTAYLPPEITGGFAVEYWLRADEFPSPIRGTLHVERKPE
jgi:hypothetical protein